MFIKAGNEGHADLEGSSLSEVREGRTGSMSAVEARDIAKLQRCLRRWQFKHDGYSSSHYICIVHQKSLLYT